MKETEIENFANYLQRFKNTLKTVFHERDDIDTFSLNRSIPIKVMRDIMEHNPFSVAIPKEYGGRGVKVKECLSMLETAAYESLPLSLTFGINIGLFLEPIGKYVQESVKSDIFKRFLEKKNMGGLMITEPNHGSDALNMTTSNELIGNEYHIKGTKHWQGLTGLADYWIITSRAKNSSGKLNRDIDFFVTDNQQRSQFVQVEEYYNNLGLYMIPYGKNKLDLKVPKIQKLIPETTGLKMMLDLLHRSRMQFPGMGIGFIKRMLDEAIEHCTKRIIGSRTLSEFDMVKHQLSRMQAAFTIGSAMCFRSSKKSGIENDLSLNQVEANTMKTVITDYMQESADTLVQLSGANGYKLNHVGGRGFLDARPFKIFEGSNEMLYNQISEAILKAMKKSKETNFFTYLKSYDLTKESVGYFKNQINFSFESFKLPQRKMVDLGKIISRIVSADLLMNLENSGFRKDLIQDSIQTMRYDVETFLSSFNSAYKLAPIIDYKDNSSWLDL